MPSTSKLIRLEEALQLINTHREFILERLHGFELRAQKFGATVSQSSLPARGLLPIEPAVVFAAKGKKTDEGLPLEYRTLSANASRREAADAYTDFTYGHGDSRNQSRKCFGVLGTPKYVIDEATQLNHAKDALKEAIQPIANFRIQIRRQDTDDPTLPKHREVSTELLRQVGKAELNLLAAYRYVPIINEPVHAVRFLMTNTRSVPRIPVRELRDRAKNRPDLLDRLNAVPGLTDDEYLLAPKKRYARMRAKVSFQRRQSEGKKMRARTIVSAELPILVVREKADSRWPDIKGPGATRPKPKSPPSKMEDEPLVTLGKQAYFRLRKEFR